MLGIFSIAVLVYVFAYFSGSSFVIDWEVENVVHPVTTQFDSYRLGIFQFPILLDNYVITQSYVASDLRVNTLPAYLLLAWLGLLVSIMMALITDLSRFWFVAAVVLLTVLFVALNLDHLLLFGSYKKVGIIMAFVLYFPSLYVFHFIKKQIGFLPRLATHLAATVIFALTVYFFSGVPLPFLHLANYGIFVPLLLTVLFAIMVGNEIITGFLRVITSGALAGEKNSLVHFLVISIVFLLNAALVLMQNAKMLDTGFYVIGSFWLLTISAVVGIWGYRAKEITYSSTFSFNPFGALLFICLAITTHLTIAYFFISGNDSFVEAIEDVIIYCQIGYSLLFVVYVITNFFDLLRINKNVGKVLYDPRRMPYFISRFAGTIAVLALFLRFNMIPYNQALAGYYSGVGDLYLKAEEYLSAAEYYKLSSVFSGTSHRANYALATMEKRNGNQIAEIDFLKQAAGKNPTPFAYANLAARYTDQKKVFESIFTLQEGIGTFPEDGHLMNNLGLNYMDLGNIDSAYYYLDASKFVDNSAQEPTANIYALLRLKDLSIKQDTLTQLLSKTNYLAASSNLVALANEIGKKSMSQQKPQFGDPDKEKIEQLIYNYNATLNDPALVDSVYLQQLQVFYDSSSTSWFEDNLKLSSAMALYRQGELSKSLQILNLLAVQNPEKVYYGLLGKIALAQNAAGLATDYFKKAFQNGKLEIAPELAFAYMEQGELEKASFIWKQILLRESSEDVSMASKMLQVIEAKSIHDVLSMDLETKFSFIKYRYREFPLDELEGMAVSFDSDDAKALALIHLCGAYLELNQNEQALALLQEVGQLNISRSDVLEEINLAQCAYAYYANDGDMMQRLYSEMKSDNIRVNNYLELFKCLEESLTLGKEKVIDDFDKISMKNPFFSEGILSSAHFFNKEMQNPDHAYEILLNAVRLNPFSIELNKAYALQCLRVGLSKYALDTKMELKSMMPSVMYETFDQEFSQLQSKMDDNTTTW